jgi:N-acetyl sugar amidotransferase
MNREDVIDKQLDELPTDIKFCDRCVVSNQRPRIHFEDGVCGACLFNNIKEDEVDWDQREAELRELCDEHRREDGRYDVVVPASGGKDSSMVAHKLKHKYDMHPLTVTWAPFEYTPIGYQNFHNFVKSGFNNMMCWQNGVIHRKLARVAFETLGDAWQPFTYGQVAYAFHIANKFDIPLGFFGENGEAEYSGNPDVFDKRGMPLGEWAEQYFKGVTVDDLIYHGLDSKEYLSEDDYNEPDLQFYRPPDVQELEELGAEFHWFSYYEKWVPQENYYYAAENTGFEANPRGRSEGTYSKYASLDDKLDGFHYYLKFIKFGIGRATADAAHEIRDGHITREEGISLIKKYDGEFPERWFDEFLEYLDITEEHFWNVVDKFRSPHVWKLEDGRWRLRNAVYHNIDPDEYDLDFTPGYFSSMPDAGKPKNRDMDHMDTEEYRA